MMSSERGTDFRLKVEATQSPPTHAGGFRRQAEDLLAWQFADSAFPTGGFAHSGGLEAAWHSGEIPNLAALETFAVAVLKQTGSGTLPLLNAVYAGPSRFDELDELADAFLINPVANRASRAQGRALAATAARIWPDRAVSAVAARVEGGIGHQGPVMGAVFAAMHLPLAVAQRVCLYTAVRGVLAAAVRLGIAGSYESQRLQYDLGGSIAAVADRARDFDEGDLAQTAPIVDVLQAAHDRLYSRLFQS
jgi:urease accessory protein